MQLPCSLSSFHVHFIDLFLLTTIYIKLHDHLHFHSKSYFNLNNSYLNFISQPNLFFETIF